MGVNGLWEILEPASTEVSLLSLALANRYRGRPPHAPYTIGVDVSIWFEQCQQQTWHRAHPRSGQNPQLRSFIYRVARLARLPLHFVFCYDGEARPHTKRGKNVSPGTHWMTRPTQRILNAFNPSSFSVAVQNSFAERLKDFGSSFLSSPPASCSLALDSFDPPSSQTIFDISSGFGLHSRLFGSFARHKLCPDLLAELAGASIRAARPSPCPAASRQAVRLCSATQPPNQTDPHTPRIVFPTDSVVLLSSTFLFISCLSSSRKSRADLTVIPGFRLSPGLLVNALHTKNRIQIYDGFINPARPPGTNAVAAVRFISNSHGAQSRLPVAESPLPMDPWLN
ncbi:hypothetical protein PAXINDRAFT_16042 [Paxillus involutus ATCC 200175]|uniref:XPG N-terminal domain-containing protein n=1 Tax=Paxillus involutus ATCC 200175 TaxID=664439 RepID=A0A0C9T5N2_PAXIN|nr:hypothetical protein PAXINDRAFT_16042 [Paxillus involutus ATCC 200175]